MSQPASVSVPIDDEDVRRLRQALEEAGHAWSPSKVTELAELVAIAGAREALDYAAGTVVPTTISDVHAYRVYSLLRAGLRFETAEIVLPALFKVPAATARRFLRYAVARFAIELSPKVSQAVRDTLVRAEWDGEQWAVDVPSTVIHDWIDDQVHLSTQPNPVPARRGTLWLLSTQTLNYLRTAAGLGEVASDGQA